MSVPGSEGSPRGFEVDASGSVWATVGALDRQFATSLKALRVMARDFGFKLADEPRALVLNPGEMCHTPEASLRLPEGQRQYLPTYRPETDFIIRLPEANNIDDHILTQGVARAFAQERFNRRNAIRMCVGSGVAGLGMATAGLGYAVLHNPWVERPGYAIIGAGIAIIPGFLRHREPPEPVIEGKGYVPPIRLVPRSEA